MSQTTYVIMDVETTGTRATRDRITEVAAIKIVEGRPTDRWSSLIYPECRIPFPVTQLTGIDDDMVREAPPFAEMAESLHAWLGDAVLVAHNARFDESFLRHEFQRCGIDYRPSQLCTLRLSRRIEPGAQHHHLGALLDRYQIETPGLHRAEHDVAALWQVWQTWQQRFTANVWQTLLDEERKRGQLPSHLDNNILNQLPTGPGVYLFYGHNRLPLYVGKSVRLRDRVRDHFQRARQDDREMRLTEQIQHVEWEETAGDLGAQLREAQLVKTLLPIMNRQLRKQRKLTTWHWPDDGTKPELLSGAALDQPASGAFYGLFRNARDARQALRTLAETHQLCPRVLGLENGKGRCFSSQVGKCRGACWGNETLSEHTRRAQAALHPQQVNTWPWPGRIAIREASKTGEKVAWHVVHQWCYQGSAATLDEAQRLDPTATSFDIDSYRILQRFLRDPDAHGLSITPLD
ncbi:3'-5' exonuclease family protein [Vreelandella gomseomensis]|uniref:Excinuclease cho n=1 Tax=Vreelandella gomseomensis TaxID=370766 RepID=A0ABU1GBG4_9GAMM|nr:exonuclease domain-containing protein [Halomonas gomseomensis]MDR5874828.1 exonuclease domain-containing protein [Halomonas gomseomensis]